ncbi:MAG: SDR family NAD(P)-dependent oxidoreductase [Prevotellaceae bacterium]|nr:SDR family NAD(P)-dependent oxidoreductase [Prevotellaceae bacterium]
MKRAIIIGASSGIGNEVAKILIAEGWSVGVAARREERLLELKQINPSMVETARIDVTDENAPQLLLELTRRLGGINLFFYASGIGKQNKSVDVSIEADTAKTNVLGFTRMIDTMFNYMAENLGGDIAVISSIAGTKGLGHAPSYSASKAYQNTYIQALEQLSNMRHLHIRFTDIRPGFVDTPLLSGEHSYPMMMDSAFVARKIVNAIKKHKHVEIIDWRYKLLVFLWRLIPNVIWRKMF